MHPLPSSEDQSSSSPSIGVILAILFFLIVCIPSNLYLLLLKPPSTERPHLAARESGRGPVLLHGYQPPPGARVAQIWSPSGVAESPRESVPRPRQHVHRQERPVQSSPADDRHSTGIACLGGDPAPYAPVETYRNTPKGGPVGVPAAL